VKVGVIGVGAVGAATALSLIERGGMCREIVVVDRIHRDGGGCWTPMRGCQSLLTRCQPGRRLRGVVV
jgi:L-lactate dehydrogenase